jgi:hypothetical protein
MSSYFSIPAKADTGYYYLNIYDTYDGHLVSSTKFHIYKYLTRILSVNPTGTTAGTSLKVKVTGFNTDFKSGTGTTVWLSQGSATIYATKNSAVASDTVISDFTIPSSAATGYYTVNTNDATDGNLSLQNGFYVYPKNIPRIISISPDQTSAAASYTPVTSTFATKYLTTGINSVWLTQGKNRISASGNAVVNDTAVYSKFYIPYTASGLYNLFVKDISGDTLTLANAVNIIPVSPFIDSIYPKTAFQKQTLGVFISGKYSSFKSGAAAVWLTKGTSTISPTGLSLYTDSLLNATFKIPPKALTGYWDVHVKDTKDDTLTRVNGFYINPAPTAAVINVNPDSGMQGFYVVVKIAGTNTWFKSGSLSVSLDNGTNTINSTSFSALDDSMITAGFNIPLNAMIGYYNVNVTDLLDGKLVKTNGFRVTHNSAINPDPAPGVFFNVYPNPFTNMILVQYTIDRNEPVSLDIYDFAGKKILSENLGNQTPGTYNHALNLSTDNIPSGMYFIRLRAGENQQTVKVVKAD